VRYRRPFELDHIRVEKSQHRGAGPRLVVRHVGDEVAATAHRNGRKRRRATSTTFVDDVAFAPRAVILVIVIEPEIRPETDLDRAAGERKRRALCDVLGRRQRYRLRFGGFRHPKGEDDERRPRGSAQREKRCAVAEVIDDLAGSQPAQRGADPLGRGDGA
jgi:hypothetical protein